MKLTKGLFLVMAIAAIFISGCVQEQSPLVGSWEYNVLSVQAIMTFKSDGTAYYQNNAAGNAAFTYREKDKLVFLTDPATGIEDKNFYFEIIGNYQALKFRDATFIKHSN